MSMLGALFSYQQGHSKAALCVSIISCPTVAQQLYLRPVLPQALVLMEVKM